MSKFTTAVEAQARREGLPGSIAISPGFCYTCGDCRDHHGFCCEHSARVAYDSGYFYEDDNFSWDSCDLCGSSLGGNRYPAHFFVDDNPQKEIVHIEVCCDCYFYLASGDEPEDWSKS